MNYSSTCERCLLNIEVPGVTIGTDGTCSVCENHDKEWGNWEQIKGERLETLEKILNKAKKKKRMYDVLVPLSGGKDSTYVLYLCRKVFNLNCLAVTWDNGFLSEHARKNIKTACDLLGVDHTYYGINQDLLMRLYKYFFLKTGFFCPVCMGGIQAAVTRTQIGFDIPLAVRGTSLRTEEYVAPEFFLSGGFGFFENTLEGSALKEEAAVLLTPSGIFSSPPSLNIPDYFDWDYDEIFNVITNELGWTARKKDEEHTDCKVDNIVAYIRQKKFPALVPEMLRYSKLVTAGLMSKDEAQKKISEHGKSMEEPGNLVWFLESLGISKTEFEQVMSNPLQHMQYLKSKSRAKRRLKCLMKRYIP